MAQGRQKLELTWIGKESRPKLEPRVLLEDAEQSYHAKQRIGNSQSLAFWLFSMAAVFRVR